MHCLILVESSFGGYCGFALVVWEVVGLGCSYFCVEKIFPLYVVRVGDM